MNFEIKVDVIYEYFMLFVTYAVVAWGVWKAVRLLNYS
jgi:hypothetical protein